MTPSEALFTKTQRRVLGLLFGAPERSFYANEVVRSAGVGIGAALRELDRLVASNLVLSARIGNQKHFQANRDAPIFEELRGIARKILAGTNLSGAHTAGSLSIPVVDLLVEFAPERRASLFDFPAMQRDFSELFGHRRVDLVPPEVLKNPYRRKTILPDLQTLYEAR